MVLKFLVIGLLAGLGAGPLASALTSSLTGDDRPQPQDWPRPMADDRPQPQDWPRPMADDRPQPQDWPRPMADDRSQPQDWPRPMADDRPQPQDWPRPMADDIPQPQDWPCPMAEDIVPCVCFTNFENSMMIDCSAAETCEQLQNAFDAEFPFKHFKELKIDQDPSDWHGSLTTLGTDTFGDVTFERIIVRGTLLTSLNPQTFAYSLSTLEYLNLANNKLDDFPFETIPLYSVLQTLILEDNYFPLLPPIESTSLRVLTISGNRGLAFNDNVFQGSPSLQEIYMARMLLPNLLPGLFLNLENITMIDLEENQLKELDEFAIATLGQSLASVNLNYNEISYVHSDAVQGLTSNAELTITNNKVQTLDQESWKNIFDQVLPLGVIDLTGNPLTCGCDMAWIMLETNDLYLPLITDTTTCSSGESVISIDPSYFCSHCPGYDCLTMSL